MPLGNAIVYYAFDDTVDSNRYPYYTTMQEYWNGWGLSTTIDNDVTVSDLRHMDDYDLCIISTHGAYYSYTTGWLFKQGAHLPHPGAAGGVLVLGRSALRLRPADPPGHQGERRLLHHPQLL